MSDFRARYDEKLKAYDSNLLSAESLTNLVSGLTRNKIKALLKRNSVLLGKVDAGKIRRPALLSTASGLAADQLIENLDQIPPLSGDPIQFLRGFVAVQANLQNQLELAVGLPARELDEVRREVLVEAESSLEKSKALEQKLAKIESESVKSKSEIDANLSRASALIEQGSSFSERLDKIKARLEEYDGDGRRANSIDKLASSIRKKGGVSPLHR